jgi:lipopolysaccharide transport system ATP-binding protein
MSTVIKVENLSKIYRLGEIGTGSVGQDVDRWFKTKVLGKEDPFLKIGEANDRGNKGNSDIVYSLRDINFEIQQGDAVGIIGRNGAGKSTLLKILSRVTTPTTGKINIKGRVASLLEVGTGFHPELTGRENIYLNGAILGMRKREINVKLDEIIDFSGVERFIDTPVKRYSSGMYVRLAFAVAAHLESEILIVDEVLAVGDVEFQKKCLGKMSSIRNSEGRTVFFVSHNMASIKQLCTSAMVLRNGALVFLGSQTNAIDLYNSGSFANSTFVHNGCITRAPGNDFIRLQRLALISRDNSTIEIGSWMDIEVNIFNYQLNKTLGLSLIFKNQDELIIFELFDEFASFQNSRVGNYNFGFNIDGRMLNVGRYSVDLIVAENRKYVVWQGEKVISFEITNKVNLDVFSGVIRPNFNINKNYEN